MVQLSDRDGRRFAVDRPYQHLGCIVGRGPHLARGRRKSSLHSVQRRRCHRNDDNGPDIAFAAEARPDGCRARDYCRGRADLLLHVLRNESPDQLPSSVLYSVMTYMCLISRSTS